MNMFIINWDFPDGLVRSWSFFVGTDASRRSECLNMSQCETDKWWTIISSDEVFCSPLTARSDEASGGVVPCSEAPSQQFFVLVGFLPSCFSFPDFFQVSPKALRLSFLADMLWNPSVMCGALSHSAKRRWRAQTATWHLFGCRWKSFFAWMSRSEEELSSREACS